MSPTNRGWELASSVRGRLKMTHGLMLPKASGALRLGQDYFAGEETGFLLHRLNKLAVTASSAIPFS